MIITAAASIPAQLLRAGDVVASQHGVYLVRINAIVPALRSGATVVFPTTNPWGGGEAVRYGTEDGIAVFHPGDLARSGESDTWVSPPDVR